MESYGVNDMGIDSGFPDPGFTQNSGVTSNSNQAGDFYSGSTFSPPPPHFPPSVSSVSTRSDSKLLNLPWYYKFPKTVMEWITRITCWLMLAFAAFAVLSAIMLTTFAFKDGVFFDREKAAKFFVGMGVTYGFTALMVGLVFVSIFFSAALYLIFCDLGIQLRIMNHARETGVR
jgi:hypothetical protein